MNRRGFLKSCVGAALTVAAGVELLRAPGPVVQLFGVPGPETTPAGQVLNGAVLTSEQLEHGIRALEAQSVSGPFYLHIHPDSPMVELLTPEQRAQVRRGEWLCSS